MPIPDNIRYLIEALRTNPSSAHTDIHTGPRAGTTVTGEQNPNGPIAHRRGDYLTYIKTQRENGEDHLSYEDWITQEQGQGK